MNTQSLVFIFVIFVGCTYALEENGYYNLPELYEMDDYNECRREKGLYCKFLLKVFPEKNDNEVWQIIESKKKNPYKFRRDILYRYKCIPRSPQSKNDDIFKQVTRQENEKLKNVSLSVQVTNMKCKKFEKTSLTKNDVMFLYIMISYVSFVILATLLHYRMQYSKEKDIIKVSEYILCFSIKRNWDKFLQPTLHPDYVRLKSFQGMKVICMFGVIMGHTMMSLIPMSTKNPEFFESIYMNPFVRFLINFGMHFVQIYLLISAWLFVNGVYPMCTSGKKIKLSPFLQAIFIRYGRLIGPLALFVFFSRTTLYKFFERGPQAGHIHINYETCNRNGWATLLLVNDYFYSEDQCYFIAWYVSADFQLFLATLLLTFIIVKYRLEEKLCLQIVLIIMGFSWIYNALTIYLNRFPVSVGTSPEKSKLENSLSSYETFAMYTALYANIGGYCVGIIGGAIYTKMKDKEIWCAKWLFRAGLVAPLMIFLSLFNYPRILSAIIGASMKPLFNTGIACFVLGMAFSKGNENQKKILKWKYLEYLSKLSYSVYISEYWTTFGQELLFQDLIEISFLKIFLIFIADAISALVLGFIVFILVESPIRELLSLMLNRNKTKKPKDI